MKLTGRGEFQIIDYLKKQSKAAPGLIKGIGDDCAVLAIPADEELLTTTDLLTEGVHFNRNWTDMRQLGRKVVAVNVSDLAAMGAKPRFLFLSLAIPKELGIEELDAFLSGLLQACELYGLVLAGGDTCASQSGFTVSISAQGSSPASSWISRSGAGIGDEIYVTGTVGDSALALQQLLAGSEPDPFLLKRHLDPLARVSTGLALAASALPTAMIDISDGLLGDLEHIFKSSGVGATIELENIPLSAAFRRELAGQAELLLLALSGGEDYELLFTAPPGAKEELGRIAGQTSVPITRIGEIVAEASGLRVFGPDGEVALPAHRGYKHFPATT